MDLTVRPATADDLATLVDLYATMEPEQTARKPVWALTDGLDHPVEASIASALSDPDAWFVVGEIDGAAVGMAWGTREPMLNRAGERLIGRIRIIYTLPDARGVGVGHAMLESVMDGMRAVGITAFDAPVGPGQRATKNFFEGHGFAARSIIMHSQDPE